MADPAHSIIFVVDGKELETKSLLLASSLARHHDVETGVRLIAYIPERTLRELDPATRALYDACGVVVARLPSYDAIWAHPYPHGNKILAAARPRTSRRTTFLDTDMVCQAQITDIQAINPSEVFVVPEGRRTWGKRASDWAQAYAFFDLPPPEAQVTLLRGKKSTTLPYFNAGFVSFSDLPLTDDGKTFGRHWLEAASDFDWLCPVPDKRPWLDQITLPLVMADHGLDCLVLPEAYNYSISNRSDLSALPDAKMIHYHRPSFFLALPQAREEMEAVVTRVPPQHRDALDLLLAVHFSLDPDAPPPALQHPEAHAPADLVQSPA